jgi:hypothetical protein
MVMKHENVSGQREEKKNYLNQGYWIDYIEEKKSIFSFSLNVCLIPLFDQGN